MKNKEKTLGLSTQVCQSYSIDRQPFQVERRGYRDPDDPRLKMVMMVHNYNNNNNNNHRIRFELKMCINLQELVCGNVWGQLQEIRPD